MDVERMRIHDEVRRWTELIMDFCFGEYYSASNCPSDLTDQVLKKIEYNPFLRNTYDSYIEQIGRNALNRLIGKHIREYWNLNNQQLHAKANSKLAKTYTEHSN